MKFQLISPEEFTNYADNSIYSNFMQSVQRDALRRKMGYSTYLVGIKDGEKVLAVGLLVEKDREAWLQNGPLLDWNNRDIVDFFLKNLLSFCKARAILEIEIYPPVLLSVRDDKGNILRSFDQNELFHTFSSNGFHHMGFSKELEFKALRWMFVKDLSSIHDMREAELSFNSSTRKKYHQTKRNLDIYVLKDKAELKKWIIPLQESNAKNHIKTRSLKYFEDFWEAFGDQASFVEARLKDTGETVSSELDIWHKNESVAFLAGTIGHLKKYNGITAIKGWQIEECLRRGQKRVNFYGVDGIFSEDNNLLNAKKGFHGEVEEYVGGFKAIINPVKYATNRISGKIKRKLKMEKK